MERTDLIQALTDRYHRDLWNPFRKGVKDYNLIEDGDQIAICISGGKDSMLLALLMRQMQKYGGIEFGLSFLSLDPGYSPENRRQLEENAALFQLPLKIFSANILMSLEKTKRSPCGLCARLRRSMLYREAQAMGCNKIALGHHFNDVIETTLMGMLYGGQIQAMRPKLYSRSYPGMQLIRPLYCVREEDILRWQNESGLRFLRCACRVTEKKDSKRDRVKELIAQLKQETPRVEQNIFHSIHKADMDTMIAYKWKGKTHSFLEDYKD